MLRHHYRLSVCLLVVMHLSCAVKRPSGAVDVGNIVNGQGEIAGGVTERGVILQSRLTVTGSFVDNDLAGAAGVGRFEISTSSHLTDPAATGWLDATAANDFIIKTRVDGLAPDTE